MLPRPHRLHRQDDIVRVVHSGKRIITPYCIIHTTLSQSTNPTSRIACVVGKKVSASAVVRHRYQRWLRVLAAESIISLPRTYDMVWVARPDIKKVTRLLELKASIQPHLKKLS